MPIPFVKYSVAGSTCVIIDERKAPLIPERQKPGFAGCVCKTSCGVGCDKVVFIQPSTRSIWEDIATDPKLARWWEPKDRIPAIGAEDRTQIIIRPFNGNGHESCYCCSSLIAAHTHLNKLSSSRVASYIIGVPDLQPSQVTVTLDAARVTVPLAARPITDRFVKYPLELISLPGSDFVKVFSGDIHSSDSQAWHISGYLVDVGEPHLIVLESVDGPGAEWPSDDLGHVSASVFWGQKVAYQTRMLDSIGRGFNYDYSLFRSGVSLSFASIDYRSSSLQLRTYERNAAAEVSICGSAAAAAMIIGSLVLPGSPPRRPLTLRVPSNDGNRERHQSVVTASTLTNYEVTYSASARPLLRGALLSPSA